MFSKGGVIFLHQMMILLVMVKHTSNFKYIHPKFLRCVPQTVNEVLYVERIKTHYEINHTKAIK